MPIIDVKSEITGNVWKIVAQVGDVIEEEAPIMILESMKMEIPVTAPETGTLVEICVTEGSTCSEGAVVARLIGLWPSIAGAEPDAHLHLLRAALRGLQPQLSRCGAAVAQVQQGCRQHAAQGRAGDFGLHVAAVVVNQRKAAKAQAGGQQVHALGQADL